MALGTALTYPWWGYPYYGGYYGYPYGYAYPGGYAYPTTYATYEAAPAQPASSQQAAVQREVVFPNGKYVLYGDGVNQAWQWIWFPAAPQPPAPPTAPPQ